MKGLKIRQLSAGVVVFRPFGKYIKFSSLELALEILTRQLDAERMLNFVSVSQDDTTELAA